MMKSKDLLKKISTFQFNISHSIQQCPSAYPKMESSTFDLEQVNNAFEKNHYTEYSPWLCLLTEYSPWLKTS